MRWREPGDGEGRGEEEVEGNEYIVIFRAYRATLKKRRNLF